MQEGQLAPVPASSETMSLAKVKMPEPVVEKVPAKFRVTTENRVLNKENVRVTAPPFEPTVFVGKGRCAVIAPAGDCPVKPRGYKESEKNHWPDGPASKEVIQEWARAVMESCEKTPHQYTVRAVAYFARYFWDINEPSFTEIRKIIYETFE